MISLLCFGTMLYLNCNNEEYRGEIMLEELKEQVFNANLELVRKGLVLYTWGNVSGISRKDGLVVIKPSGVDYEKMTADDMTVVDLLSGKTVEGRYKPSSDTQTHLEIYRTFSSVGGVVHTHSTFATSFAQAGSDIAALGTTHADYFYGDIPCTRELTSYEVQNDYELNTGKVIVAEFNKRNINPLSVPAVLVKNHGVFTFGENPDKAVYHAVVVEEVAKMAFNTLQINLNAEMNSYILDKHYQRKHGANAYYGQN